MFVFDFLILSISFFICVIAAGLMIRHSLSSPISETWLLSLALIFAALFFLGTIPITIFYTDGSVSPWAILIHRISIVIGHYGILSLGFCVILPNFKTNYRSIFLVFILTSATTLSAFTNFLTLTDIISNGSLLIVLEPIGLFLFVAHFSMLVILVFYRINEVLKVVQNRKTPFRFLKSFMIFITLGLLTIAVGVLTRMFPSSIFPSFFWSLSFSLTVLYFIYNFFLDKPFLFITTASLEAVIITDQRSGLVTFSENLKKDLPAEDLLGGIFMALNVSLKEAVQSQRSLEQLNFGDKVVVIAPGNWATTLLIVSESNFITTAISRYLTKEFERNYREELLGLRNGELLDKTKFESFTEMILEIRPYIPL